MGLAHPSRLYSMIWLCSLFSFLFFNFLFFSFLFFSFLSFLSFLSLFLCFSLVLSGFISIGG